MTFLAPIDYSLSLQPEPLDQSTARRLEIRLLQEPPLEGHGLLEEQVPQLLGGQVVKLCLEGEGLGGDGLVGGVVVGGEVGVGEGLLHVEAGGGVEAEEAVQDGAEVLVARAPVQDNTRQTFCTYRS